MLAGGSYFERGREVFWMGAPQIWAIWESPGELKKKNTDSPDLIFRDLDLIVQGRDKESVFFFS